MALFEAESQVKPGCYLQQFASDLEARIDGVP